MKEQRFEFRHLSGEVSNALRNSQFLWALLKSALIALILIKSLRFGYNDLMDQQHTLVDFETFHIAGRLALEGRLWEAYHPSLMRQAQMALSNEETFMPWTYPLPFSLVASALALFPVGLSYFLFSGLTLLSFLSVLKALLTEQFRLTVFLIIPALLVNLSCGQNGLLTATLMGLTCYGYLNGKSWVGIPLGLMVIKPHLVAGITMYFILRREWGLLATAIVTAFVFIVLATGVFGLAVWNDYFISIHEATQFLHNGLYPMHRMTSAYSVLLTLTRNYDWASLAQLSSILVALGIQMWTVHEKLPRQSALGFACITSTMYSPYFYDYDLTVLGLGIGLLLSTLWNQLSVSQWLLLAVSLLVAQGGWFLQVLEEFLELPATQTGKLSLSFFS